MAPPGTRRRWRRWQFVALGAITLVCGGVAWGEWAGWPFLADPLERLLSGALDRRVRLTESADAGPVPNGAARFHFVGGVHVSAPYLEIAAPAWSKAQHQLLARDVSLELSYVDLWHAHRGAPFHVRRLRASALDVDVERLADGRASWQLGPAAAPSDTATKPTPVPLLDHLQVGAATLHYRDLVQRIELDAQASLTEAEASATLRVNATGHIRGSPLKARLVSSGLPPWDTDHNSAAPVAISLKATVGSASFAFDGHSSDALRLRTLDSRFVIEGPSLAAAADPFGVTLPTTPPFRTAGRIVRQVDDWQVEVEDATIGTSKLHGRFTYDSGRKVPLLAGRLSGTRLALFDLGPALGTGPRAVSAPDRGAPKVLPDRPFDLASLRAMDADVQLDIAEVDLHSAHIEPLRPLRGHLRLAGGVLTLGNIDARVGQGRIQGELALDGRGSQALWTSALRWDGIRLEHWIRQQRSGKEAPPFVSGALVGKASLRGRGLSTAQILADLAGEFHSELDDGAVSHLAIEVLGLDVAQALGVKIKGDDALAVPCAVIDLVAEGGVFRPRAIILDSGDSVVWLDGSVSLAAESIDLKVVVMPRDFSPMSVRTPLLIRGSIGAPVVSLQKGPLARKIGAALLLALVNPLAALIPFVDPGNAQAAEHGAARCRSLMARAAASVR